MDEQQLTLVVAGVASGTLLVMALGFLLLFRAWYRRAPAGKALVVTTSRGIIVAREGMLVYPIVNQAELIDLTVRTLRFERMGKDALATSDGARVDVRATFLIKVNDTRTDIEEAARKIGCARASDEAALRELFEAKFTTALATVIHAFSLAHLLGRRDEVSDKTIEVIGRDLSGFVIDGLALDHLEQTPPDAAGPFR